MRRSPRCGGPNGYLTLLCLARTEGISWHRLEMAKYRYGIACRLGSATPSETRNTPQIDPNERVSLLRIRPKAVVSPANLVCGECRCAACVDELTGVRTLDISSIADDIIIDDMQLVGNYALRIDWSDGHSTGLYSWKLLRALCPCERCAGRGPGSLG